MMKNWMHHGCLIPYWGDECEGKESLVGWSCLYWDSDNRGRKRWVAFFGDFILFSLHMGRYWLKAVSAQSHAKNKKIDKKEISIAKSTNPLYKRGSKIKILKN